MNKYQRTELAELWANAEGCEGGDYLRALAGLYGMSHYSSFGEEIVEGILGALIDAEIASWRRHAISEYAEFEGWDPEQVIKILAVERGFNE
jgi:hypothetical protein